MKSCHLCMCECHSVIPVHISDRVAAASACSKCHDAHVQRYVRTEDRKPHPPRPADATGTTEDCD
jgi:hypothetical protein